ncbi:MAG: hypothetical protein F9K13_07295 [Candidatus Methylomirabilis oxygeniifera]|uniref:Uncharacterized protein n=1 Tax=Methylomirabilis oxygeniifera TaxID=671143 RepID=D5ML50_METO1|nr:MAG: hypothetical protein F9K13_07295 [Candidatus Methylomirabilis oxyfera]CBE69892.1 exported protein of unknown function [Candidatus Methylomirabilis oxyfera]
MQMSHKSLLVTILSLAVSVFMFADISHAKKINKAKPSSEVKVGAHLGPWDTSPEPNAEGEAKHEKETKRGVVKKDEFEGAVKVPVDPMSGLGIVDQATATDADIRMILSHADGTEFAECHLEFDGFDDHDSYNYVDSRDDHNDDDDDDDNHYGAQAEYKVEVALKVLRKKGVVLVKHGVCDINLANADAAGNAVIDLGIPDAQAGDVATAILVDPSEADKNPADRTLDTEFLEGTFVIK